MQLANDSRDHSGFSQEFRAHNQLYEPYNESSLERTRRELKLSFLMQTHTCSQRCCQIFKNVLPIGFSLFMEMLIDLSNIFFAGHFENPIYLPATGLAIAISNIFGVASMVGLASALDTLASAAFNAQNFLLTGHYFNQTRIIVVIGSLFFVLPMYLFMGPILYAVGVEPELANTTGEYLRILYPAVFFYIQATLVRKFFRAQRVSWVQIAVICFTVPFHIIGLYVFTSVLGYGFQIIPAWTIATQGAGCLGMYFYLYCCDVVNPDTLVRFSCQDLKGWKDFLRVGIPDMILVCLEWWSFEITTVALAFLGTVYLGSHVVLVLFAGSIYILSAFGFSVTGSSLVGSAISVGEVRRAKRFAIEIIIYGTLMSWTLVLIFYLLSTALIRFISIDSNTQEMLDDIVGLMLVESVVEGFGGILNGVLRGIGKQKMSLFIMLVVFYIFFQPISLYFAFHGYYLKAIWGSLILTTAIVSITNFLLLLCTDWKEAAIEARERMSGGDNEEPLLEIDH